MIASQVAAQLDFQSSFIFILRWLHVLFGIIWIGHLYFFNFVNGPFAKTMDADTKKKVVPELMPRALWWFRMAAMMTFVTGLGMLAIYLKTDRAYFHTARGYWIMIGALLGIVMWFNVWFVIWPRQSKLIGWLKAGEKNPDAEKLTRQAFLASRANTYLSGPMLLCMLAAVNFPEYFSAPVAGASLVLGAGVMHLLIDQSGKVTNAV